MDLVVLFCSVAVVFLRISYSYAETIYSHTWAAHIEGGDKIAKTLAEKHGFTYLGQIMPDVYHLRHNHVSKRSLTPNDHHHTNLHSEPQVHWLEQQIVKKRVKRAIFFNDPKWPKMWYLNRGGGLDMNVAGAWQAGFHGKDIVVSILDDGIEKDHPDLRKNYDAQASYDVNSHDDDPQPRYDYTNENRHGTRCAGEVAAQANNGVCNVGVAFDAKIGGVRMLDGDVTDAVEAASLSLNPQHIDIYSASWGPDDDGRTVDGPAKLALQAFKSGIEKGRKGKGNIFVWASGNGGRDQDSCNCDGYTNSIYTLSISSATESGHIPWYSEACSSTLSTTYSSGSGKEHQVITTDLRKGCTETHTGTSASAPLAAGICALALSANRNLTWRDMQHIVVMTSRPSNLKAEDWVVNGIGRRVSHSFGFGLMDASAMVSLAKNWTTVPRQHICKVKSYDSPRTISQHGKVQVSLQSNGCEGSANEVNYLEHVQAVITLSTKNRGQVQIFLTSPMGTRSILLKSRPRDTSSEGFHEWAFMTTHSWGEQSKGRWTLEVENAGSTSTLNSWSLTMYGTVTDPTKDLPAEHRPKDCYQESPNSQNLYCVGKCPLSFYAVNRTTVAATSTTVTAGRTTTTTTTTTTPTTTTLQPSKTVKSSPFEITTPSVSPGLSSSVSATAKQPAVNVTCLPCSAGCDECVDKGTCVTCSKNYKLINSTCVFVRGPIMNFLGNYMTITVVSVLCALAVMVFLMVFGILTLCERESCAAGECKYKQLENDVEFGSPGNKSGRLKNLNGSIQYNKGARNSDQATSLLEDLDSDS